MSSVTICKVQIRLVQTNKSVISKSCFFFSHKSSAFYFCQFETYIRWRIFQKRRNGSENNYENSFKYYIEIFPVIFWGPKIVKFYFKLVKSEINIRSVNLCSKGDFSLVLFLNKNSSSFQIKRQLIFPPCCCQLFCRCFCSVFVKEWSTFFRKCRPSEKESPNLLDAKRWL